MRHSWIVAAFAASACATAAPSGPPAPLVRAEVSPDVAAAAAGEARVTVRTVTAASAGAEAIADCVAVGEGFRADFTSPAEVAVPAFGSASTPVTVRCAAGDLRGAAVTEPSARRTNGLAGWPAIGVGFGSGGGSYVSVGGFWEGGWGTGPQSVAVRYPDVEVVLQ